MADGENDKNAIGDKLIAAACKAFGIGRKFVMASRYDEATGEAIILTNGGTRVRYKDGDKVENLDEIEITGIPKPRKVIAGKGAK
jgi:hypothetical protein